MKTIAIFHGLATFVHERLEWSLVGRSVSRAIRDWVIVRRRRGIYDHG